jgi:hypothetical protein
MRTTLVLGLAMIAAPASALEQKKHLELSQDACLRASLPNEFCRSVARAAYNVDSDEFENMAAHGQTADGETACDAANLALARGRALGEMVFANLVDGQDSSLLAAARLMGQTLHLVQDVCTHAGMPNPQHAWWSDSDVCHQTDLSPDLQPEAAHCAVLWSDIVMTAFARVVATTGVSRDRLDAVRTDGTRIPPLSQLCDYVSSAPRWDGIDRRWNNDAVLPLLTAVVAEAIEGGDWSYPDACADGPRTIARVPDAPVDTSGDPTCSLTQSLCDVANPSRGENEPKLANADGCSLAAGARSTGGG